MSIVVALRSMATNSRVNQRVYLLVSRALPCSAWWTTQAIQFWINVSEVNLVPFLAKTAPSFFALTQLLERIMLDVLDVRTCRARSELPAERGSIRWDRLRRPFVVWTQDKTPLAFSRDNGLRRDITVGIIAASTTLSRGLPRRLLWIGIIYYV